jgi:hypothetical protein
MALKGYMSRLRMIMCLFDTVRVQLFTTRTQLALLFVRAISYGMHFVITCINDAVLYPMIAESSTVSENIHGGGTGTRPRRPRP